MKRNYLLIAAGLFCALTMQAQKKVVASLDFEDPSQKGAFKTDWALTPELGFYGDYVNYKESDTWDEQCKEDPHSGEYCFMAANSGNVGYTWDRGFKLSFPMQLETPYRVSFWAKVDPSYSGPDGGGNRTIESTELTSWLSKGMENYDKSILSYGLDHVTGPSADVLFNGEWQHVTYLVYNPTAEAQDATMPSWQGGGVFPIPFGGDGTTTYRQFFEDKLPEVYFFIANMFCPVTYYLDDIVIEENVAVKEVTYSSEIIKIDFGYATNITSLANTNGGTISLEPSCVSVTQDGEPVEVAYVEGKSDGFLYIFVNEELLEDSEVVVNFTGDDRLLYTAAARPSSNTTGDVVVFPVEDEKAYWDEEVYAEALAYGVPTVKRSTPVNGSFNLLAEEVTELSMTFTSKIDISKAKGSLQNGKAKKDVTSLMSLSADGLTITVPVTAEDLADGVNVFAVDGLQNETGTEKNISAEISFEIGEVSGDGSLLVVYKSDFEI